MDDRASGKLPWLIVGVGVSVLNALGPKEDAASVNVFPSLATSGWLLAMREGGFGQTTQHFLPSGRTIVNAEDWSRSLELTSIEPFSPIDSGNGRHACG